VSADASVESQAGGSGSKQGWRGVFVLGLFAGGIAFRAGRLAVTSREYGIFNNIVVRRWSSAQTESTPTDSSYYYY
jgi:hypothetical protein